MKCKIVFFMLLFASMVSADTSDYIWNEQFSKKIAEAEAGKIRSQYDVGNMYLKGQGTGINEAKAFKWFSTAAKSGHTKSQFKLGLMLLNGTGVQHNYKKAESWLRKAAKKDYAPAQYYLAGMYRDGQYLAKSYDKSLFWLKKAKANGFWKAATEYDKLIALVQRSGTSPASTRAAKPASRAKPKSVSRPTNDLTNLLLTGQWFERGKPAKYLPSAVTRCNRSGSGISCISSKDLKGKRGNTEFTYRIIVKINNILEAGEFSATYQNNVISVTPGKPVIIPGEDGEPDITRPSPLIETGLQRTVHSLECQLESTKQIGCVKDLLRNIKLTRR